MVRGIRKKSNASFTKGNYRQFKSSNVFSGPKASKPKRTVKIPANSWKFLIFFFVLGIGVYFLFFSSIFEIKDIFVEGNHYVDSNIIINQIPKGQNIFRMNSNKLIADMLHQMPEIQDVQIYRGIPNAVKVVVLEREGKIVWQSNGKNYLISTQGQVMRELTNDQLGTYPQVVDTKNIPVELGSVLVSPNFIAFVTNLEDNFFTATNIKPKNFQIESTTFDVNLYTEAGFYVKFNSLRSSKKQLDNLKIVLASKRQDIHEYVDMRINGWAYYK